MVEVEKVAGKHLFSSDLYEIKALSCDFSQDKAPLKGYNDCFCLMLVKTGGVQFEVSKQSFQLHTGHVLIDKPDYEYRMSATSAQCTVLNFSNDFYLRLSEELQLDHTGFFANQNALTQLLMADPVVEYLHHQLLQYPYLSQIELDGLVFELLDCMVKKASLDKVDATDNTAKKFHLPIIERAKEYIHQQFQNDFSLFDLSSFACASPFHFSRIFKRYTSASPHQYVLNVRLKHSEMLLKNTAKPITDIAYQCGFNNAEYFATAFKQKYGLSPSLYKQKSPELLAPLFQGFQIP